MTDITANNTNWTELQQAEDMAYFRADLCLYSPESYSLDEKREICEQMDLSSRATEEALRADFDSLPPFAQDKLPDLLKQADPSNFAWRLEILAGKTPDCVSDVL